MRLAGGKKASGGVLGVLPMTSMIDVVFLLLIFFMVTASFSADEKQLNAAISAEGSGRADALQPQIVRLRDSEAGTVYEIGSHRLRTVRSLENVLLALPKEQGVVFRVEDGVPIADAAAALQAAHNAGFIKRSYVPSSGS